MKNWIKPILTLLLCIGLFSCNLNVKRTTSSSSKEGYSIFHVGRTFCKQNDLPVIKFSLEYPNHLLTSIAEPQYENYNYNAFFNWNENEVQTEGIYLGYCYFESDYFESSDVEKEELSKELWQQLTRDHSEHFQLSNIKTGKMAFDNEHYFMFRANAHAKNSKSDAEFEGNYILQTLILEPQGTNDNGLVITFLANAESEIRTFEDFANKGDLSAIWKSLKFE